MDRCELLIRRVDNGYAIWDMVTATARIHHGAVVEAPRWVFTNAIDMADWLENHLSAKKPPAPVEAR